MRGGIRLTTLLPTILKIYRLCAIAYKLYIIIYNYIIMTIIIGNINVHALSSFNSRYPVL